MQCVTWMVSNMQITNVSKSRLVLSTNDVLEVGGVVDAPDFDTEHLVMKAWIDAGLIEVVDIQITPDAKPVGKMTVPELETYIKDNGGEFAESDNKPELLVIAQDIEDAKNAKD